MPKLFGKVVVAVMMMMMMMMMIMMVMVIDTLLYSKNVIIMKFIYIFRHLFTQCFQSVADDMEIAVIQSADHILNSFDLSIRCSTAIILLPLLLSPASTVLLILVMVCKTALFCSSYAFPCLLLFLFQQIRRSFHGEGKTAHLKEPPCDQGETVMGASPVPFAEYFNCHIR